MDQSYKLQHFNIGPLAADSLYITGESNAIDWVTIDDILAFDCIHMTFGAFLFSENDINRLLKTVVHGNSRLEYFRIALKPMNHELIISGLNAVERETTVVRQYSHEKFGTPIQFEGGTDFRCVSGDVATFKQEQPRNPNNPDEKTSFIMVAWKIKPL
ncbi:hypothetical protein CAEBREN_10047 [Caenorhabditis brenneri]|uniref:Sdz-33 F-box domain-containing protein n=1 Tax=Caenorhabditis brenneri TaxID=135651 RepID=G0P7X5_CAEBE|nr:hypothetical protein CAEBREN_10047 [Caenorhabditis brenneri]